MKNFLHLNCYMNNIKTIYYIVDRAILKDLLKKSSKFNDCARLVLSNDPIPLRFRRALAKNRFPCVIETKETNLVFD